MTTEQPVHQCVCAQLHPNELIQVWRRRASMTMRRMSLRCRPVNLPDMAATLVLITRMSTGDPACFSAANSHRSHHIEDCPCAARNRGRVVKTRSPREVVEASQVPAPLWRML